MGSGQSTSSQPSSSGFSRPNNTVNVSAIPVTPYSINSVSGVKKSLLIGINYTGQSFALNGCINDVNNIATLLSSWGFSNTLMTDSSSGSLYPSKQNILNEIQNQVSSLSANDCLVIYYSGHGTRVTDTNGDEITGLDSCIVPINVRSVGYITDDEIRSRLVNAPSGAKVFCGFDSCNSGSICDLRYCYFDTSYRASLETKDSPLIQRTNAIINTKYSDTNCDVISISGSRDDELSMEFVNQSGVAGGALTYCILYVLKTETPNINISDFLTKVRNQLKSLGFTQNPSLMSGKDIDTSAIKVNTFLNI